MGWRDLSIVEGAVALVLLGVLCWTIWTSRKTRRFRAGIFVERDEDADDQDGRND